MLFLHSLEKLFYCVIVWHGSINILGNAKLKNNIVGFNNVVRFPPLCKSLEFGKLTGTGIGFQNFFSMKVHCLQLPSSNQVGTT